MTFTYEPGTTLGNVRLYLGDTDPDNPLLYDEEISVVLIRVGQDEIHAAANCARALGGRFAQKATARDIGDLKLTYLNRSQEFRDLADVLEKNLSAVFVGAYCGGLSRADKLVNEVDSDLVQPSFRRHGMDNKYASNGDDVDGI